MDSLNKDILGSFIAHQASHAFQGASVLRGYSIIDLAYDQEYLQGLHPMVRNLCTAYNILRGEQEIDRFVEICKTLVIDEDYYNKHNNNNTIIGNKQKDTIASNMVSIISYMLKDQYISNVIQFAINENHMQAVYLVFSNMSRSILFASGNNSLLSASRIRSLSDKLKNDIMSLLSHK
ncbi:MAG: hypothetical protein P9L92_06055 [Candidatus Electryonea clarkiae]|nr:hypothetical protein [Candidatus Electryonea clarkiae]